MIFQLVSGLATGGTYAIFAIGYTLVFSILGIINFAHAAVFTLGAYMTYLLIGKGITSGVMAGTDLPFEMSFIVAMLVSAFLAGLISVLIDSIAFRPLRRRKADSLLALVTSLGITIILVNGIQYLFGTDSYSFPAKVLGDMPPNVKFDILNETVAIRTKTLVVMGVSVVIAVLLTLFITKTKTGRGLRAISEDPTTASLMGINTNRLIMIAFFLSGFIAGLAGTLVAWNVSSGITDPYFGVKFGLKGLSVIVLGGLGNIPGAIIGGLVIGVAEAFAPSEYSDAVAFGILFVVLLVRPQGILGQKVQQKV
ncbi:MAG: branched-chain amino acid ABC transporter permease [bacterium]|nr:branched-chain amino acid ABC transporter permease [bacterium]